MNLHLVKKSGVEYGTLQESIAIAAWRKLERIELLRTIAVVTAQVNPEKAQQALQRLIEESFPEVARDRERSVDRAMEIMDREKTRSYKVAPVGQSLGKNSWDRLKNILGRRRRTR